MGNKIEKIVDKPRDEMIRLIFNNYPDYEVYQKLPNNKVLISSLYCLTNYKKLNEFQKYNIGDYKDDETNSRRRDQYKRLGPIKASFYLKFSKFHPDLGQKCVRCGKIMKIYSESGDTYNFDTSYCLEYICQDKQCGMWYKEQYFGKCIIF
jgi:hypothetical protein